MSSATPEAALSLEDARALARRHGLASLSGRPGLRGYLAELWRRRQFVVTLSAAQSAAQYEKHRLGQLWSLLNPMLLIVSYFLVFGLLLRTNRGVENFIAFLSIGVVLFGVTASVISSGAKAITNNLGLVRALRFPRAALPVSVALSQLYTSWPAFALLVVLTPLTGEPFTWHWLLFPLAVALQFVQLTGIALVAARVVNASRDLANFIPLIVRLMRYTSGVFFSISVFADRFPPLVGDVLLNQPFALQLELGRQALLAEHPLALHSWLMGLGWAVGLLALGVVVFWRGEGTYGRG
ncbi:ABC transporter permease [Phycicoccus flavus]|uniref:ABC transporter permease n=1 Tax=Phycicoccus flavus TaxID=2502783 RepID=UPI000FEB940A|nr:ABC transporter permease [Phycicoccus flavus]NHA68012.1 ABC transporter permease [Phycicoccus flavus]